MEVSVIVPVYNAERYLQNCIESILKQSFTEFELILIDDGSQDRSGQICDEYAREDCRIKVVHQPNFGQSAARNQGVKVSQGKWICFVDSDDRIHPRMLEYLYNAVLENDAKISMCNALESNSMPESFFESVDASFESNIVDEHFLKKLLFLKYYYWVVWAKLIHRNIVEQYPLKEGRIYEDNAIVCKWLQMAGRVSFSSQCMYFYCTNTEGTTKKQFSEKQFDYLWALKEQLLFYEQLGYSDMWQEIAERYIFDGAHLILRARHEMGKCSAVKTRKRELLSFVLRYIKRCHLSKKKKVELLFLLYPKVQTFYNNCKKIKFSLFQSKSNDL